MVTTAQLSENLLKQIANLVDGNQAKADEVQSVDAKTEMFQADLSVQWQFEGIYEDQRVAGGKKSSNHFTHKNQFEHQTQIYGQCATFDKTLRRNFINKLISLNTASLKEADSRQTFYQFEPFSLEERCSKCNGKGRNYCSSCGGSGRVNCSSCGGSGKQSYAVTTYDSSGNSNGTRWDYRPCPSCSGGQNSCSSCSGRGSLRCSPCEGTGYFMITRAIYAVAMPSYRIGTNAGFAQEELESLLNSQGTTFCYEKITFDDVFFEEIADDKCQFSYRGEGFLLSQRFSLKSNIYQCYAVSNPPYPFVKPAIFDDLFSDELAFLKKAIPENGKINKQKAFEFFVRYSGQPVLEQSMREIALHRMEENQLLGEKLETVCQGYISSSMAMELSGYLNKIMDKVSPAYSSCVWRIWMLIAFVGAFIFTEDRFEQTFLHSPFGTIIGTLLSILFIFIAGSAIAWLLSCFITLLARRKVPKEYRQKMRNKEPFKRAFIGLCVVSLLGAVYGYSATKAWLPKLNSVPTDWLMAQAHSQKSWFCPMVEKFNRKPDFCDVTQKKDKPKKKQK